MRMLAEEANDLTVRAMMLRIAADYDKLARNADDRAAQDSIMFRLVGPDDKTSVGAAIEPKVKRQRCQDARWVCENHPDKPRGRGQDECGGAAGMPCPDYNEAHDGERPAMSDDFIPAFDRDKGPVH
jgi:hypothetical protein